MIDEWKSIAFFLFLCFFLFNISIEYPIFGIILLSIIIILCFYIFVVTRDIDTSPTTEVNQDSYNEAFKLAEEKRKREQKEKNIRKATIKQLVRKLPKDFETIIKKNYDKFIPQLIEYLQDNSKIVDRLDRE